MSAKYVIPDNEFENILACMSIETLLSFSNDMRKLFYDEPDEDIAQYYRHRINQIAAMIKERS